MILCVETEHQTIWTILHGCGDDPHEFPKLDPGKNLFSTDVEMILRILKFYVLMNTILHGCGGDPLASFMGGLFMRYSPQSWRQYKI